MTIDELMRIYSDAARAGSTFPQYETPDHRAGIAAVVRALRDEMDRQRGDDWRWGDTVYFFNEILGAAVDEVAGRVGETKHPDVTSPATDPAPAPCLWRVHHETRNGPLYVSQCDGEWRHATADPKCPSCGKEIFFPTDPAPAVCVWRVVQSPMNAFFLAGCSKKPIEGSESDYCPSCGKPIKFTEAQR